MREGLAILAVLVAAVALGVAVVSFRGTGSDGGGSAEVRDRMDLLSSRTGELDKKLRDSSDKVARLAERLSVLDETTRGLAKGRAAVGSEVELSRKIDSILGEKLKNVKWPTEREVKFVPKTATDKKFLEAAAAFQKAAGLDAGMNEEMMGLLLHQRARLSQANDDAKARKLSDDEKNKLFAQTKQEFDGILKWRLTEEQLKKYDEWRKTLAEGTYEKRFFVP